MDKSRLQGVACDQSLPNCPNENQIREVREKAEKWLVAQKLKNEDRNFKAGMDSVTFGGDSAESKPEKPNCMPEEFCKKLNGEVGEQIVQTCRPKVCNIFDSGTILDIVIFDGNNENITLS